MNTQQIFELFTLDKKYFKKVEPRLKTNLKDKNEPFELPTQKFTPFPDNQKDIAALLKRQDTLVIAQLYDAYGAALYGYVVRILHCSVLAEQVIQDTFLKVWQHGASYDPSKGRLFTWLLNIARNTAIDTTRNSHFHNSKKTDHIDTLVCFSGGHCLNPDTVGLKEVVKKMDDKHKVLIDLIYFNQYTHQEAAEALGLPLGTVKTRVRTAILELKKAFDI